jgi:hypothetical protein
VLGVRVLREALRAVPSCQYPVNTSHITAEEARLVLVLFVFPWVLATGYRFTQSVPESPLPRLRGRRLR